MEWSQENVLLLLDLYHKRDILWRARHQLYYNSVKKEDAWHEIGEILKIDVLEIKKKIENLKDS